VRISVSVTNQSWRGGRTPPEEFSGLGRRADDAGFDTVWVPDHLLQMDPTVPDEDTEILEAYALLGFLAGQTSRVRLGALVSNVTLRPPALLIKAVSTLDALSGGRTWLGVGAGYAGEEARRTGVPLPEVGERFERLEETLQLAHQVWAGDESPFVGRHYQLAHPLDSPRPARRPRVLVGGTGERKTLRLVARYADACNLFDVPDDGQTVRHKLDVLKGHCDDVGRTTAIETTLSTRLGADESSDDLARRCERLDAWGIDHLIFVSSTPWRTDDLATLAGAVRLVADLGLDRTEPPIRTDSGRDHESHHRRTDPRSA